MKSVFKRTRLSIANSVAAAALIFGAQIAVAQDVPATDDDSTVTYPAAYFAQYSPFSVNDMLDRIPGITVARGGGGNQGGPGSSGGSDRRGLGGGGDQVLINGRRLAGKDNEGNSQLARIPASQVQYIEIIRGTSENLDVRGANQVINIVLTEAESNQTYAYEVNVDRLQDGKNQPGAKLSINGQSGAFDYFLSGEIEPRWQFRDGFETSLNADGSLNDTINRDETTNGHPLTLVANLGYEFTENDAAHLNMQWVDNEFDSKTDRTITNFNTTPEIARDEFDFSPSDNSSWEIAGDYEHIFDNGNRFKTLFVVNEREDDSIRERFVIDNSLFNKDLFLSNYERNRERIIRPSYIFSITESQGIEVGVERAQTILDTSLQLGLLRDEPGGPEFGGLTPVTNSNGTVEELRYEYFAIHNWQLSNRMSLESTLIYETSEISQSGDVSKSRDFEFLRPKLDYRFDITPTLQFRASIEKDVAQLSFSDFTSSISGGDDDQNTISGNPDLRQEQSWRYETYLEYRFPEDAGVINANLFYHELEDVIERVTVDEEAVLSANGNIGDGERYGINLDSSLRLNFINQPNMLVTAGLGLEESSVTDPFLGIDRRVARQGEGNYSLGFRHEIPSRNMNWGFRYRKQFSGEVYFYDIDRIEQYPQDRFYNTWFEVQRGWYDLVYRFEAMDTGLRCRVRSRYTNGSIATGFLNEVEDSCSDTGLKLAIKIRGTF